MAEEYSMLILAGGKSSRMGSDKAELMLGETPFWEILADKGRLAGIEKIYLSRGEEKEVSKAVRLVYDKYRDRGPLGGMQAAFEKMDTPYCLVVSVDLPQIPIEVIERLLKRHQEKIGAVCGTEALLLEHGDRKEPLIGIYPTACASLIEEEIRERSCAVFRILDRIGYQTDVQDVENWQVESVNTPERFNEIRTRFYENR